MWDVLGNTAAADAHMTDTTGMMFQPESKIILGILVSKDVFNLSIGPQFHHI